MRAYLMYTRRITLWLDEAASRSLRKGDRKDDLYNLVGLDGRTHLLHY